jgi:CheY-like chemotaxis protein
VTIRNYFKKTRKSESERQKSLHDPEQTLAWMEELFRLGTALDLKFPGAGILPSRGLLEKVDEESGTLTVRLQWKPAEEPVPGYRAETVFPMDGQRFQMDLVYQGRGNYMEYRFSLPTAIHHAERRDSVRVKMLPQDKLKVLALQNMAEGLGVGGELVDLSMGGCCLRLERVIRIQDEKQVPIATDLLPPGTPMALVRLPNLPDLPLVECGGYLCYLRETDQGVIAGLRFESLGAFETGILGKFLSERLPGFTYGFPHKRRLRDLNPDELQMPQPRQSTDSPEELLLGSEAAGPDEEDDDDLQMVSDVASEIRDALTDQERRNKLRKRGKRILLVIGDELERMLFMAMLHQDGYRCFFEARSLVQALNHNRKIPLDLLVVDQAIGHLDALNLVDILRDKGLAKEVPVVVMRRKQDARLALAAKAGKVNLLVDRPVDFTGTVKLAMEGMLGLNDSASLSHPYAS